MIEPASEAEIRKRLDAVTDADPTPTHMVWDGDKSWMIRSDQDIARAELFRHAESDIEWLLDELRRLRGRTKYEIRSPRERVYHVYRTVHDELIATFPLRRDAKALVEQLYGEEVTPSSSE